MEKVETVKNAIASRKNGSRNSVNSGPVGVAPGHDLPPVTVSGWIKKRPSTLKNVSARTTTPKMKAAIQRAKASRARSAANKLPPKPYLDEVIVLGERVRLNETGISASILQGEGNTSELALFTPSYFPGESDYSKITQAKTVFSKVFGPGSKFGVKNPVPPCEVSEFNLLKEGLQNRLYILRKQLPSNLEDVVSMEVRNIYQRAEQFNSVIQAIESNESLCTNYELNFDAGQSNEIKGYGKQISREERERIQNLIRQFSFLVLQSIHRVDGYETMTGDITPEFLINSLEQQQITKDDMDKYIAEFTEGTNSEIPDLIAQTLEGTGTQDDVYALMLESELLNLISYVKQSVTENLTDAQLKVKFIGFAKSIETTPIRDQVVAIMKWILTEYSAHKEIISNNIDAINLNKSKSDNLQAALSEKSVLIRELESKVAQNNNELKQASEKIDQLTADLAKSSQDTIHNESAIVKGNRELVEQLAVRTGERDVLLSELNTLKASNVEALKKVGDARGTVGVLGSALDTVAKPRSIPLMKSVEQIAKTYGKTPELCGINETFKELCDKFSAHSPEEKLSEVCYLNYFVSFFIEKIFANNFDLYKTADKLVSDYLTAHPESIDNILEELLKLLEYVEKPGVRAPGHYITYDTPSKLLTDIYKLPTTDFNAAAKNEFMKTFSNYFRKYIYFIPSGFILKPMKSVKVDVFKLTGQEFKATGEPVEPNVFNEVSLPYSTLFIMYILFAKNYLIRQNPKECPIPKILTNSLVEIEKKSRRIQFKNVVPTPVINNPTV